MGLVGLAEGVDDPRLERARDFGVLGARDQVHVHVIMAVHDVLTYVAVCSRSGPLTVSRLALAVSGWV